MPLSYIASSLWSWLLDTGLSLALLLVCALLIPRAGRLAMYIITHKIVDSIDNDENETKTHLAFAGVIVYVAQIIAYFVVFVFFLQEIGFSLAGAAIPATAASAAIGLGAQSIIADFLAGFFILTEKQYGVGDWVRFEGGATNIEGTVIQITMRSTRIRTLAEETVIIPNSKAGVSINNSNHWSSAVVVMPVPLLGSQSISEIIERSTQAAQRALTRDTINDVVLGPVAVHPAVDVHAPATVGNPWSVDMRFLVQVKPGSQWLVERALRVTIIQEFWNDYAHTTALPSGVSSHGEDNADSATANLPSHTSQLSHPTSVTTEHPTTNTIPASPKGTLSPDEAERKTERGLLTEKDPAVPDKPTTVTIKASDDNTSRWGRVLSFGGRVRSSTSVLIAIAVIIVILQAMTIETGTDQPNGWLAPDSNTIPEPTPELAPMPSLTTNPPEPTSSTLPEDTNPESTQTSEARRDDDTDGTDGTVGGDGANDPDANNTDARSGGNAASGSEAATPTSVNPSPELAPRSVPSAVENQPEPLELGESPNQEQP